MKLDEIPRRRLGKEENLIEMHKGEGMTPGVVRRFRDIIRRHYRESGRVQPWRETRDPYCILVSELMLQQTQVERVMEKYPAFISRFPGFHQLESAPLQEVLAEWQGLGYNRRAVHLHKLAGAVVKEHKGLLPDSIHELEKLPGIGPYTAGAIRAFAFNLPAVIIETNIRRVFLHFFFPGEAKVPDSDLFPLIERTLDRKNPREWYYALMDYGTELKKKVPNPNRRSRHYTRQSPFEGSWRQMRSRVLREVLKSPVMKPAQLSKKCGIDTATVQKILAELEGEGFPVGKPPKSPKGGLEEKVT